MNQDLKFLQLIRQYLDIGILKGTEILLSPKLALKMANELRELGIPLMGITGWYLLKEGEIVEDLDVDYYVGDEIFLSENAVAESHDAVKTYLLNRLPETATYISLDLNIPQWMGIIEQLKDEK